MNIKNNLLFYWKVGQTINRDSSSSENIIKKYSDYGSYHYGLSKVFSRTNVKNMMMFNKLFPVFLDDFNKLSWEHYILLINIYSLKERFFYLRISLFCHISVDELNLLISNRIFYVI